MNAKRTTKLLLGLVAAGAVLLLWAREGQARDFRRGRGHRVGPAARSHVGGGGLSLRVGRPGGLGRRLAWRGYRGARRGPVVIHRLPAGRRVIVVHRRPLRRRAIIGRQPYRPGFGLSINLLFGR